MSSHVVKHAPRVRCYVCGLPDIAAVCHHCERPMCSNHRGEPPSHIDGLLSSEFSGLGLREMPCGEEAVHCADCRHVVRSPKLLLLAALLLITLIVLVPPGRGRLGSVGAPVAAILLAGVAVFDYRRRTTIVRQGRPALPLVPRFNSVRIRETVRSKLILGPDGACRASIQSAEGALSIQASLSKLDQTRLERYRRKYRLTAEDDIEAHAGFAVLRGCVGLEFVGGSPRSVLPLTSQASAQPFLLAQDDRQSGEWHSTHSYRLSRNGQSGRPPVWIVPSLIQEAGQRGLDLDVTWSEGSESEPAERKIEKIVRLDLRVPVTWGEIKEVKPDAVLDQGVDDITGDGFRAITWRKVSLEDERSQGRRRTLSVFFENPVPSNDTIRGRLEARFGGCFSGVEGVEIYYPLGTTCRLDEAKPELSTLVIVDFELSLANLRHQQVRIVPDRHSPEKDQDRKSTFTFPGVPPGHETVMSLIHAMSEAFYVKRLIENPPRPTDEAHTVSRYWDLGGRCYSGVYPIDFHLILTGIVVYDRTERPSGGTTEVTLTVQGAYANREMEEEIENVWERLSHLVHETISNMGEMAASSAPRSEDAEEPRTSNTGGGTPGQAERNAGLRKRQDELLGALLAGRISEPTFLRLKDEIDRELERL